MALKTCKNGHTFDTNVYGDNCPFCPDGETINIKGGETVVNEVHTVSSGFLEAEPSNPIKTNKTKLGINNNVGGGTIIKTFGGGLSDSGANKKLVGLLVTYDINPLGEVYKLYEGRNLIGRGSTMDIQIKGDQQISTEHLLILFRSAEGVFWATDQKSSNGTFVNNEFKNESQLKSFDVITIGNTNLTFIAIPEIRKQE